MRKDKIISFVQSILSAISLTWLFIEAHNALDTSLWEISFSSLMILGSSIGFFWFIINGFFLQGYLKNSIKIESNAIQPEINIFFGEIFQQEGYTAISVNDFFDSIVDDRHISSNSLHGKMLQKYWAANISDWDDQVQNQLSDTNILENTSRNLNAKNQRFEIGTTVLTSCNTHQFLCTALTKTDIDNLECSTTPQNFLKAVQALLKKARSVCSGHSLNIPLLGSGLSRTGIKDNILVDIILLAIFTESKNSKITDSINIVLPKNKKGNINLRNIWEDWK